MAPNYTEFPERRAELRAEVGRLLEEDKSRAGEVYRTSLDDVQARRGTGTQATNENDYILPALLNGRVPAAVEPRKKVAARVRVWLKKKPLSDELRADLEAQLQEIEALSGRAVPAKPVGVGAEDEPREPTRAKRRFEVPEDTDRLVLARARKEQSRLRDSLLQGRTEAPCDLCGRLLSKELLVAAHIVPRRELDHNERAQFDRIAMVACQLGCDRLFELGYLTVDEEGAICPRSVEDELMPILAGFAGRRCAAHNDETAAAFAAHRDMSPR